MGRDLEGGQVRAGKWEMRMRTSDTADLGSSVEGRRGCYSAVPQHTEVGEGESMWRKSWEGT